MYCIPISPETEIKTLSRRAFQNDHSIPAIYYLHIPLIHLVYPPKFLHKLCFQFPLGFTILPRGIENNTCAKSFGGDQGVLWECASSEWKSAILAVL